MEATVGCKIFAGSNSAGFSYIKGRICGLASALRIAKTTSAIGILDTATLTDVDPLTQSPAHAPRADIAGTVNILKAVRLLGI